MKTRSLRTLVAAGLALGFAPLASAQTTFQWSGGGTNDNISTADNWTNGVAPTATDTNVFVFTGTNRLTPILTNGDYRASAIVFDAASGAFTIQGVTTTANTRFQVPAVGLVITQASPNNQQINAILLGTNSLTLAGTGAGTLTLAGLRTAVNNSLIVANRSVTFASGFMTANNATNLTYFIGSSTNASATFSSDPFNQVAGTRLLQLGSTNPGIASQLFITGDFTTAGNVNLRSGTATNNPVTISGSGAATFGSLSFEANAARTLLVNNTNTNGTTFSGTTTLGGAASARTNIFNVGSNSLLTLAGPVVNGPTTGGLSKFGAGTLALSGTNTYTGGTAVNGGTLDLRQSAALTFVIGGNGTNNTLGGTTNGTVLLNGQFLFNLATASTNTGDSWVIVTNALNTAYATNFLVSGFNGAGGLWTNSTNGVNYVFAQSTGLLTVQAAGGYAGWVSYWQGVDPGFTNTAATADPDGDSFINNLEFAFDGNPAVGSPALLSAFRSGTNAVFRFVARDSGVTYSVKGATNLASGPWTNATVTVTNAADQTGLNLPADYTRKEFTVPGTGNQFFKIEAAVAP